MGKFPDTLKRLVDRFAQQADTILRPDYNETLIRIDFINPLMRALGWDIDNNQGFAEQYREVVHEDRVKVAGQTKAPDYSFRVGGTRKFFLEAKKPSVDIRNNVEPAYQLRRYAWSAKLACSLLTDFEEFAIYDTRIRPVHLEKASVGRREYIVYTDYEARWDFLDGTFSKNAVLLGEFDRYCESKKGRGASQFDEAFLTEIEGWRKAIASSIARNNEIDEPSLNFSVQRIIDRIIFLRIAEDRGTETVGQLQALLGGEKVYDRLRKLFRDADARYNSGLFHFAKEKDRDEAPDTLTPTLEVDDKTLKGIIKALYYPQSPYEFTVVSADILGSVYERFLGKVITLTAGHNAKIVEKPEVRKAGGVYYTPKYIVDYIVANTVGKLLEGKSPKDAAKIKVLDPACGSGSFLIGAYQYLLDWYLARYNPRTPNPEPRTPNPEPRTPNPASLVTGKHAVLRPTATGDFTLTIGERKRILLDHIHGVDLDGQAVEVTKLNLLLKCLEGETSQTLGFESRLFRERALPDLGKNILCGNSLIGTDIIGTKAWAGMSDETRFATKPFDFDKAFVNVFKDQKGFAAVIGNPPYIDSEWMSVHWPETREYCVKHYEAATGNWDIFCAFLDKAESLSRLGGFTSMIVPNKLATAGYATGARRALAIRSSVISLRDYSAVKVFPVSVYPIVVTASRMKKMPTDVVVVERVFEVEEGQQIIKAKTKSYSGFADAERGWDLSLTVEHRSLVDAIQARCTPLKDIATVLGAATVSEAYQLSSLITESTDDLLELRVINSGTIDRFASLWGQKAIRYLGRKLQKPVIAELSQKMLPLKRLQQARTPKLVIAGMTLRLECAFDERGETLAAKSTTIIYGNPKLDVLLGILNSNLVRFIYDQEFGGDKLQGGYLRVGPPQIERLPIPGLEGQVAVQLDAWVRSMLSLHSRLSTEKLPQRREQLQREIEATDRQIDQLVYQLYGLTDDEIAIVEAATA